MGALTAVLVLLASLALLPLGAMPGPQTADLDELLTLEQVCKILRICTRTGLRLMAKKGAFPVPILLHSGRRRIRRWRKSTIDRWLGRKEKEAAACA
jgi:predicted DNA-binding transcriptional regulator AlpA